MMIRLGVERTVPSMIQQVSQNRYGAQTAPVASEPSRVTRMCRRKPRVKGCCRDSIFRTDQPYDGKFSSAEVSQINREL